MMFDGAALLLSSRRYDTMKSTPFFISSDISEKFAGEGSPLTFADVETIGMRNLSHSRLENSSRVMRIPTLPSLARRFAAMFFA